MMPRAVPAKHSHGGIAKCDRTPIWAHHFYVNSHYYRQVCYRQCVVKSDSSIGGICDQSTFDICMQHDDPMSIGIVQSLHDICEFASSVGGKQQTRGTCCPAGRVLCLLVMVCANMAGCETHDRRNSPSSQSLHTCVPIFITPQFIYKNAHPTAEKLHSA
jgi:hypothetical protein